MAAERSFLRLLLHAIVVRPFVHVVFGLSVRGRENLPDRGPFLLTANHNSHLDILVLFAALPLREVCRTHAVAAREYFERNRVVFRLVDFLFKPIWVDREHRTGDPVSEMGARLDAGENVVIFPEGTRGEAGQMGRFHTGAARLVAEREGVPLLPAFLLGSERAMPRRAALPVPVWQHVTFGPPQAARGTVGEITDALRESIEALGRSETAARHRRRGDRGRPLTVAVLGIDGSGKSTLSRRLAHDVDADVRTCLIGDRLELFTGGTPRGAQPLAKERIRRWLSARAKAAKSLARYQVPKLMELLLRDALLGEAKRWYGPDRIVMDGSPLLNMAAWSVLYRDGDPDPDFCAAGIRFLSGQSLKRCDRRRLFSDFPVLRPLARLGLARLSLPDAVFFVDVDPDVAMQRIEARGEDVQVHETPEKLARLRNAYLVVVDIVREHFGRTAHVLDGEATIDEVAFAARRLLEEENGS